MGNLKNALFDLKAEVVAGKSVDEIVASIAADYSLNPALLRRKFVESYRSEEAVRATVQATSVATAVEQHTQKMADEYKVPVEAMRVVSYNGQKYNVICRDGNILKMVRQSDGWRCQINAHKAHGMELVS